jgi:membrane protein
MLPIEAAYPTVEKGRLPVVRSRNTSPLRWWAIARRVYVLDVVQRAAAGFWRHGAAIYAAAMSYYVLLTLFPLLILVVAVVGLLAHDPAVEERIVGVILGRFPAEVNLRPSVEAVVSGVARTNPGLLGTLGLLGALVTASGMFGTLRSALNSAFDVPGARSFVRGKVVDLVSMLGVLGLVALSIAATALLGLFRAGADHLSSGMLPTLAWGLAYFLLPFGLSFVTFLGAYWLIPNLTIKLRELWIGALLAAVGFELAKSGFGLYVANFSRYPELYGALGGAVVLLVFVYVTSSIVIFAAEVTSELVKDRARADERELEEQADVIERELLATLRLPALHGSERPGLPITTASA